MSPLRAIVSVAALCAPLQVASAQAPQNSPAAGKRASCTADVKAKRLKGMERADSMQLCMAEARVDCVKEAIAKKMPMAERKDFMKTCME